MFLGVLVYRYVTFFLYFIIFFNYSVILMMQRIRKEEMRKFVFNESRVEIKLEALSSAY